MCPSLALPSKQAVNKADFHQTTVKENEQVAKSTSVQKMNILQVPTNTRVVRLYNKNGYFLKISTVGKLRGTRSFDNPDSKYKLMNHKFNTLLVRDHSFGRYAMFWSVHAN